MPHDGLAAMAPPPHHAQLNNLRRHCWRYKDGANGLSSRSQRVVAVAMSAEKFIMCSFNKRRWRPTLEDGNSRGSLRGVRQDLESCESRSRGRKGERVGYQRCSAAAIRLFLSCPSQSEKVRFFRSGPQSRVVDGGDFGPSIVHFCHGLSSTAHQNEEAACSCRPKGTSNDRHQSGGR